jgi:hypothetical protein
MTAPAAVAANGARTPLIRPPSRLASHPVTDNVLVTPDIARTWEAKFAPNRLIRTSRVKGFARDMARGAWAENGESIKFDENGTLIDGEHRIRAVILSGVSVWMAVTHGVRRAVRHTVDTGTKRTAADMLGMNGEVNANLLAATARWVLCWQSGTMLTTEVFSNDEINDAIAADPSIRDSVRLVAGTKATSVCPPAPLAFVHFVASMSNPDLANEFLHMIATGTHENGDGLRAGHPVLLLRDRLINHRVTKAKLRPSEIMALLIKAWNATQAGIAVKSLRWRNKGERPEPFPEFTQSAAPSA